MGNELSGLIKKLLCFVEDLKEIKISVMEIRDFMREQQLFNERMERLVKDKFLVPDEVAEKLNVDVQAVHRWIKTGKLKAKKHGNAYRIPVSELYENEHVEKVIKNKGIDEQFREELNFIFGKGA